MHRLSKLSAAFLGKKSGASDGPLPFRVDQASLSGKGTEVTSDDNYSKIGEANVLLPKDEELPQEMMEVSGGKVSDLERPRNLQLPNILEVPVTDKRTDDEWFETGIGSPMSTRMVFKSAIETVNPDQKIELGKGSERGTDLSAILPPDSAVDIDVMEQSLISLLENFRTGQMKALSLERIEQMRNARREMEELSTLHVRLHRMQLSDTPISSSNVDLDEAYDSLFQKLDNFHDSVQNMSFNAFVASSDEVRPEIRVEQPLEGLIDMKKKHANYCFQFADYYSVQNSLQYYERSETELRMSFIFF